MEETQTPLTTSLASHLAAPGLSTGEALARVAELLKSPRRVRTQNLSLTLAGRNLATWTNYTGFDPELNWNGSSNFSTAEFLTQPQVRYFTARLSIGW